MVNGILWGYITESRNTSFDAKKTEHALDES